MMNLFNFGKWSVERSIENGDKCFFAGDEALDDERYHVAIDLFTEAITYYKKAKKDGLGKLSLTYKSRSRAYMELEQYEQAITDQTSVIDMHEPVNAYNAMLYEQRGYLHYMNDDWDKANADYAKAILICMAEEGYETNPEIQNILAEIYLARALSTRESIEDIICDCTNAIACYRMSDLSESKMNLAKTYEVRGKNYAKFKQYTETIADYKLAIDTYKEAENYQQDLDILVAIANINAAVGMIYFQSHKYGLAIEHYGVAIDQYFAIEGAESDAEIQECLADTFTKRGTAYVAVKKGNNAIRDYSESITIYETLAVFQDDDDIQKDLALNYFYKAFAFLELGRVGEATPFLDKALERFIDIDDGTDQLVLNAIDTIHKLKTFLRKGNRK